MREGWGSCKCKGEGGGGELDAIYGSAMGAQLVNGVLVLVAHL